MDQIAQYIGYAYGALAGVRLILAGAKAVAALNGSDGPEDKALDQAESWLDKADAALARFMPNPLKKAS